MNEDIIRKALQLINNRMNEQICLLVNPQFMRPVKQKKEYHDFKHKVEFEASKGEVRKWLRENTSGKYCFRRPGFTECDAVAFDKLDDALNFKLVWG